MAVAAHDSCIILLSGEVQCLLSIIALKSTSMSTLRKFLLSDAVTLLVLTATVLCA